MLAVAEDDVTTKIEHGENAGRTLANDAIVRRLIRVSPGQTTATIPVDPAWRSLAVAALLQDRNTLAIDSAASARP